MNFFGLNLTREGFKKLKNLIRNVLLAFFYFFIISAKCESIAESVNLEIEVMRPYKDESVSGLFEIVVDAKQNDNINITVSSPPYSSPAFTETRNCLNCSGLSFYVNSINYTNNEQMKIEVVNGYGSDTTYVYVSN